MIDKHLWGVVSLLVLVECVGCSQVILQVTPQPSNGQMTAVPMQSTLPTPELSVDTSYPITQEDTVTVDLDASNPQVLQAMKDLTNRTSIPLEEIKLVDFEFVVWPDSGLGCPQPGMVYPQVQQDGMRIRLRAGGVVYEYHSGESRPPFLCEKTGSTKPTPIASNTND
jgi:hypothetical protein